MPEPSSANRLGHADSLSSLLTGNSGGDLLPELPFHFPPM